MSEFSDRLAQLRAKMQEHGLDAYFLLNNDAHNSEYLADADKIMPWISNFKGSNGQMLFTMTEALLWTDGRYWLAAEKELPECWKMMKMAAGVPRWFEWCKENLQAGAVIGFDAQTYPAQSGVIRTQYFADLGMSFKPVASNLANEIWGADRPAYPSDLIRLHTDDFAGTPATEKISKVIEKIDADHLLVVELDQIAWTLNLRGNDIEYNPVFFSFMVMSKETKKIVLFVNPDKTSDVSSYLESIGVEIQPYGNVGDYLSGLTGSVQVPNGECNVYLSEKVANAVNKSTPIELLKCVKTTREVEGMRACQIRDGAAKSIYLSWLSRELNSGREDLNEYDAAQELLRQRSRQEHFMGPSFETISSSGENGAVIHYSPEATGSRLLSLKELYLCDSGGQYLDGTTDTTRAYHFGTPTERERDCFTRVLMGNLDLQMAIWPKTSRMTGADLDLLARRPLWQVGLDYNHGTGHGVGYHLYCHEGPQYVGRGSDVVLEPGMCVTDEPGYYEAGAFGIRIEDLLFTTVNESMPSQLCFENVTKVPYDRNLIKVELLSPGQIKHINDYHAKVYREISPGIESLGESEALDWLKKATAPIS